MSEAVALLRNWPILPVEKALELLDYAYADQEVRSFAVQCLLNVRYGELRFCERFRCNCGFFLVMKICCCIYCN